MALSLPHGLSATSEIFLNTELPRCPPRMPSSFAVSQGHLQPDHKAFYQSGPLPFLCIPPVPSQSSVPISYSQAFAYSVLSGGIAYPPFPVNLCPSIKVPHKCSLLLSSLTALGWFGASFTQEPTYFPLPSTGDWGPLTLCWMTYWTHPGAQRGRVVSGRGPCWGRKERMLTSPWPSSSLYAGCSLSTRCRHAGLLAEPGPDQPERWPVGHLVPCCQQPEGHEGRPGK